MPRKRLRVRLYQDPEASTPACRKGLIETDRLPNILDEQSDVIQLLDRADGGLEPCATTCAAGRNAVRAPSSSRRAFGRSRSCSAKDSRSVLMRLLMAASGDVPALTCPRRPEAGKEPNQVHLVAAASSQFAVKSSTLSNPDSGQIVRDLPDGNRHDRIDDDLALVHLVATTDLHMRPLPDAVLHLILPRRMPSRRRLVNTYGADSTASERIADLNRRKPIARRTPRRGLSSRRRRNIAPLGGCGAARGVEIPGGAGRRTSRLKPALTNALKERIKRGQYDRIEA